MTTGRINQVARRSAREGGAAVAQGAHAQALARSPCLPPDMTAQRGEREGGGRKGGRGDWREGPETHHQHTHTHHHPPPHPHPPSPGQSLTDSAPLARDRAASAESGRTLVPGGGDEPAPHGNASSGHRPTQPNPHTLGAPPQKGRARRGEGKGRGRCASARTKAPLTPRRRGDTRSAEQPHTKRTPRTRQDPARTRKPHAASDGRGGDTGS